MAIAQSLFHDPCLPVQWILSGKAWALSNPGGSNPGAINPDGSKLEQSDKIR